MAEKRSARLKKILAADPAFTNVLVGILALCYQSLWIVIAYGAGLMTFGRSFGWDIQLAMVGAITVLTLPYLFVSLSLASSSTQRARRIVMISSCLIGAASAVFCAGFFLEVGTHLKWSFAATRLPFVLMGVFALARISMLRTRPGEE